MLQARRLVVPTLFVALLLAASPACRKPNKLPPQTFSCLNHPTVTPDLPGDVDLPRHPEVLCFAWQQFIALNWPVLAGSPGQPDRARPVADFGEPGDATPTVWETYKEVHQIFLPDGSRPRAWGTIDLIADLPRELRAVLPLGDVPVFEMAQDRGLHVLHMTSKLSPAALHLAAEQQADGNWLTAQNGKLTYYAIHVNRVEFDYIVANGFYDASRQANATIELPVGRTGAGTSGRPAAEGSIEVKSAWVELTPGMDRRRFRTLEACVPTGVGCRFRTVGLVGLHVVHKTETFPQWSWATFEHVDNAPDREEIRKGTVGSGYTYHDPTCTTCTPNSRPAGTPLYQPTQVVRQTPIAADVALLNDQVHGLIRFANPDSVWQHYELVNVQWPEAPEPDAAGGVAPLPTGGPTPTSIANTTLETYLQHTTCLDCHQGARIACSGAANQAGTRNRASDYSFLFSMAKEATPSGDCP